jgi:putative endonuclease
MDEPHRREQSAGQAPRRAGSAHTSGLGGAGERLVASWLEAHGLRVLARNWRCAYGEIDVIAEDAGELVFVEVKTRRGTALGAPEEAITSRKRRHLILAAQSYIALGDVAEERPYRIDVVAVQLAPSGKLLDIRHYPSAVALEE